METEIKSKVGSYLSFKIGSEEFAIHVDHVLSILEVQQITKIPKAPEYLKGIINLRGKVLPVIDTRVKLNMPATEYTNNTCIIVMDLQMNNELIQIGALADSVSAVLEIDETKINNSPEIGNGYKAEFIEGIVDVDEHFILILDVIKLFTTQEIIELKKSNNLIK